MWLKSINFLDAQVCLTCVSSRLCEFIVLEELEMQKEERPAGLFLCSFLLTWHRSNRSVKASPAPDSTVGRLNCISI